MGHIIAICLVRQRNRWSRRTVPRHGKSATSAGKLAQEKQPSGSNKIKYRGLIIPNDRHTGRKSIRRSTSISPVILPSYYIRANSLFLFIIFRSFGKAEHNYEGLPRLQKLNENKRRSFLPFMH